MIYKFLIRNILFLIQPEIVHDLIVLILKLPLVSKIFKIIYRFEHSNLKRKHLGIEFKNPVGLAAGFDKNAEIFAEMGDLGFGFVEIGTITPRPQPGNPKPRIFRLPADTALINRMGFNNAGADEAVKHLQKRKGNLIIAANIGKNKTTPNDEAYKDYEICFQKLFNYVDFFVVNVSSPNTPGLRELQEKEPLKKILQHLQKINAGFENRKPILLKIAPDLGNKQLDEILEIINECELDGVVATNTTIGRDNLKTPGNRISRIGTGGLSGKPLRERATEVISYLQKKSGGKLFIIGVGGIHTPEDALEKIKAGASLIELYTGFIYEGPGIIKKINQQICRL